MGKEYGVTKMRTEVCELCGKEGDVGFMARIFRPDGKTNWIHDECGAALVDSAKEKKVAEG